MEEILRYFPELTERQRAQFAALGELYAAWNAKINVISRREMGAGSSGAVANSSFGSRAGANSGYGAGADANPEVEAGYGAGSEARAGSGADAGSETGADYGEFYTRHVLHSLAIARACRFAAGARVLDVGTGGGFPAVPLAIMFPGAHFTAVDSIGKKIRVVVEVARAIGLENLTAVNGRAENIPGRFDYVVSRAVAPAASLTDWTWSKIERGGAGSIPNGMLLLKGGDLAAELAATGHVHTISDISEWFDGEFFETKKVVYLKK
ncbi:MAG: 16S rRNA (guanine(527)-N(7))-methyltransferase RsmG [Alistipes sp.]|jgi:16S rRNA (guanine527-N7)-methyltransferase|nr:16S rRNA (guanine(527)-N(7))-methyltransferase RsmG [Alistipes sp.]